MFERLNTPQELFHFKLGAALTMEQNVLEMLGKLEEEAQRQPLKEQFHHHADETRQQIQNIEKAFQALGEEPDDSPCPAIQGLDKESKANIRKADDSVVDAVILSGAAETEHHEIAVYEGLITHAQAMGAGRGGAPAAGEPRAGAAHARGGQAAHRADRPRVSRRRGVDPLTAWRCDGRGLVCRMPPPTRPVVHQSSRTSRRGRRSTPPEPHAEVDPSMGALGRARRSTQSVGLTEAMNLLRTA
jgi:ferritin-like metal-binding protein YciE